MPSGNERKQARKKRHLEERRRQNSYSQITDWNGDLPTPVSNDRTPLRSKISNRCMVKKSHIVIMGILLFICVISIALSIGFGVSNMNRKPPSRIAGLELHPPPSATPLRRFSKAAIIADADECAEIGETMLRRSGTAVDATVAALLCISLVNSQSAGIGGGFLMTLYDKQTGEASALIAREAAPGNASEDMYSSDPMAAQLGWRAIGVPGEVAGFWEAHQKYGKLPWKSLFQPTIRLAREGYRINHHQAKSIRKYKDDLYNDPAMRSVFFNATTGSPLIEGDLVKRPVFADTLQALAEGGAAALYGGELGQKLTKDIQRNGGIITLQDLKDYRARWMKPATAELHDGVKIFGVPPPGSGHLIAFIFNILDGYEYSKNAPRNKEELNLMYHRMVEAFKFAYARRTDLADPLFTNIASLMKNLTSGEYADQIRAMIDDSRTFNDANHYGAHVAPVEDAGTSHLSVIDMYGNAVSATSTVNLFFGAKIMSPSTGIVLNNEMDDFSIPGVKNYFGLPPSPSNFIKPGKMMVSSMCPTLFIAPDGNVRLVTGGAGGTRITSATAYTAFRHLYLGEDVKTANDFPRMHHQLFPMTLNYNEGFPATTVAYLADRGHNTELFHKLSVVAALSKQGELIEGNMDFRKGAGAVRGL